MSGIAGGVSTRGDGIEVAVRRMTRAMVYRGEECDGYGEFEITSSSGPGGGRAGLAARVRGPAQRSPYGWQPLIHPETGDAIVVDSEFLNGRQLRARLKSRGVTFRGYGDAELLLNAMVVFGQAVLEEIDGGYAFAFYKASSRRILLGRDPLGIKPLYVAAFSHGYVFGSEVRAVLASGLVSEELDPAGVASYLAYGAPQDPLTVHRQIRSFPAGCAEWIGTDLARVPACGSQVGLSRVIGDQVHDGGADAVDVLQERLAAAVRDACQSESVVGLMLGDAPSGIVGALASRHTPVKLLSFSVGYLGNREDTSLARAAEVAHAIDSRHQQVVLGDDWIVQQWRQWMLAADRPSIGGLEVFVAAGAAADLECSVALSGLGGRLLLLNSLAVAVDANQIGGTFGTALGESSSWLANVRRMMGGRSQRRTLRERNDAVIEAVTRQYRVMNDHDLAGFGFQAGSLGLTPQFLAPGTVAAVENATCERGRLGILADFDLHVASGALRDADGNSNAHAVSLRHPFLSMSVIRQAAQLADEQGRGQSREPGTVFERVVAGACPGMSLRPFEASPPWPDWLIGPLRDECEVALDAVAECPLFSADAVRQLWRRQVHLSHVMNSSVSLALVILGSYLRHTHSRRNERLTEAL